MGHAMPLLRKKSIFFDVDIVVKEQIVCGLGLSVLLSTMIRVITVVKICCGLTRLRLVSPQHFDHCDDAYPLSIRVKAVKYEIQKHSTCRAT